MSLELADVPARGAARGLVQHGRAVVGRRPGAGAPLARRRQRRPQPPVKAKAKSVIQIFLWGGMSHNDTWDPKPDVGLRLHGRVRQGDPHQRATASSSASCSPNWPSRPTSISLIRSMTHRNNGHETAAYLMQTGAHARRAAGLSERRGRVRAVQEPGLQGADSALRGADPAAGAVLRRGLPGAEVQAVRHRRRPERAALRGGRRRRPGHHRRPAEGPARTARAR